MKVLVTGSDGSLMQAVIPKLLEDGHTVTGVDNLSRYKSRGKQTGYDFIEGDLCDFSLVRELVKEPEIIIQAAATIYGVSGFHKYQADILGRDVQLHSNILRALTSEGKKTKVVYISSSMVYERAMEVPTPERALDDMQIPKTDYGLSKLVGERLSAAYWRQYKIPFTVWRPFNIITPFEKAESEPGISHVFADFIDRIIVRNENPMRILGDGKQIRSFTWIEDVAEVIAHLSFDSRSDNKSFNIGTGDRISMVELAQKIFNLGKRKGVIQGNSALSFEHLPIPETDVRVRVPDVEKMKYTFGWSAKTKLEEALDRCVDYAIQETKQ